LLGSYGASLRKQKIDHSYRVCGEAKNVEGYQKSENIASTHIYTWIMRISRWYIHRELASL
jgi:hypothetical protein